MDRNKTNRWLCLLGTVVSVVVVYIICIPKQVQEAAKTELPLAEGLGPASMPHDGEQDFRQLRQLIGHSIDTNEWQVGGSSSLSPYRRIVSVLTNGEGCKTFTDDGDGNLVPEVASANDSTELTNNPFDDSNGLGSERR